MLGHVVKRLTWLFRDGCRIPLCFKNILCVPQQSGLSTSLLHRLAHQGIFVPSQTIHYWIFGAPVYKTDQQLGLAGMDANEWCNFLNTLRNVGLCYGQGGDQIIWDGPLKENSVIVKDAYQHINSSLYTE